MLRKYRDWESNEFVVVGVDTAAGMGDYSAAQFISKNKLDVPLIYHSKQTATEMTPIIHIELEKIYDQTHIRPVVAYERANGGAFEMDRLASLNRMGKYIIFHMPGYGEGSPGITKKLGWDTNSATRPKMLQDLKEAVDKKLLRIYDKPTVNEFFSFIVVQTSTSWKAKAERGAHDDLVMSLAIAWQLYQTEEPPVAQSASLIQDEDLFEGDILDGF